MTLLEVTDQPSESDLSAIGDKIAAFNDEDIGPSGRQPLAVLIRDANGQVIGGLSGRISWGWLFIQLLFVPEHLRGQGLAGKLLAKAEEEARARGCHGAWLDTFNPQALRAYQRQGYEIFGELPSYPPGRTRSFLQKHL
jgi:GNAT superfamily N-acetyltransferase